MQEKELITPDDLTKDVAEAVISEGDIDGDKDRDIALEELCDVGLRVEDDKSITLTKHGISSKCPIDGSICNSKCHHFFIQYLSEEKEFSLICALSREEAAYHIPKDKFKNNETN